jgi:hypothetical protein
MTAEYFVQRSTNDVPRMAFKNISICSFVREFVAYINTRPGAKQRHFLCKYYSSVVRKGDPLEVHVCQIVRFCSPKTLHILIYEII